MEAKRVRDQAFSGRRYSSEMSDAVPQKGAGRALFYNKMNAAGEKMEAKRVRVQAFSGQREKVDLVGEATTTTQRDRTSTLSPITQGRGLERGQCPLTPLEKIKA